MTAEIQWNGRLWEVDLGNPLSIGLPIVNGADNPNCYFSDQVKITPIIQGDFSGSLALGGPVNHMTISLSPHGNGTHTECSGHVINNGHTMKSVGKIAPVYAQLISVQPIEYNDDLIISRESLLTIDLQNNISAIILRTIPNSIEKLTKNYSGSNPVYMTIEAVEYLVEKEILHLILDIPSVDREDDGGKLSGHKVFWGNSEREKGATITVLAFIEDRIKDGIYLLDLQTLLLELDVSPSNPVLYSLNTITN